MQRSIHIADAGSAVFSRRAGLRNAGAVMHVGGYGTVARFGCTPCTNSHKGFSAGRHVPTGANCQASNCLTEVATRFGEGSIQMIVFTRTASIAPGKAGAAAAFAHQVAAYLKSSVGVEIEVLMPVGGNPYRITWTGRYQNLGEFEEKNLKMLADQKYI